VEIERPTLVSTQTEDGLTLDGLYTASDPGTTAILAVHGLTMNAFDPLFLARASTFCSRAYAFLSANTRGHDLGVAFRTPHGEVLGGSWWERVRGLFGRPRGVDPIPDRTRPLPRRMARVELRRAEGRPLGGTDQDRAPGAGPA